ncbi:AlpA family phage regulatory protein [Lysobacter sp. H21R4]|uniref:helix-turn-helix transcriptional regulator n=1 Tax=Lysobacter sp. H21R4 TaxID=2781021 RepID=UPI001887B02B|nr:AlpA family phage regulatory protein [Lysobacter sp. H21R4]QOY62647.1 AlpA family phage regulatory protein [Lysobacter sp. H21R4]
MTNDVTREIAVRSIQSFYRINTVVYLTGLSRSTIYNYLNPNSPFYQASFPKRRKIGLRAVGWNSGEVIQWIASRDLAA